MTKIILIRSAESEGDLYRIAQGHYDSNLTDRGRRQVKALEKRFADIQIDAIYTSDLYRACATASAISKHKNLVANLRKELREIRMGAWEGKSWGNIAYEGAEQLKCFKTALDNWCVDGAETQMQAMERMVNAIGHIASENKGKSVAVVSHGFAIRLLLAEIQGIPIGNAHELPIQNNTAVSVIEADGNKLNLVFQDDASHLRAPDCQPHEKPDAQPELDTNMYFHPLPWVEYGNIMADAVECVWEEAGEDRPFDKGVLLEDAAMRTTIIGFVEHDPAGFLQFGREPGRIAMLCTHPGCRKAGLGVQLIGQAVMIARAQGGDHLSVALPKQNPHRRFFLDYGFVPVGKTEEGRELLEKDIRFDLALLNQR